MSAAYLGNLAPIENGEVVCIIEMTSTLNTAETVPQGERISSQTSYNLTMSLKELIQVGRIYFNNKDHG